MKKRLLMGAMLMLTLSQTALAQTRTISGRVRDQKTGEGLPGVTVLLKGTTTGTATNADGSFTLAVPPGGTLIFSSVGMNTQEKPVGSNDQVSVALTQNSRELSEVVVTALGIEKDKRTLGYATQEIQGAAVAAKSEPNVLNALQGKVSGVSITGASGLAGTSTNINIRGITSLTGSNQPLFVVDGIPVSNDTDRTNGGAAGTLYGAQTANRAADIDPENIASISILKGPAAAALYGSRASSGAILITTKSGANVNKKLEVVVNTGFNFQTVLGLPDFQNDYGQGTGGTNTTSAGGGNILTGNTNSWGPRFGTAATRPNGLLLANNTTLPYESYPDNIRKFYKTGTLWTNGLQLAGNNGSANFSLNVNSTTQKGITESSSLQRTNIQLGGGTTLQNRIRLTGSVNFSQTDQLAPQTGNGGSAFGTLSAVPRSFDLQGQPTQTVTGGNLYFSGLDNPNWNLLNNNTASNVTRFINVASIGYDFFPWLSVVYRAGLDTYTDRRKQIAAVTSSRNPTGLIFQDNIQYAEFTGDLLITAKKENIFLDKLNATLLVGQQTNQRRRNEQYVSAATLSQPGFYNTINAAVFTGSGETNYTRRLLGYYADLSLAYNNYLFLEGTARVDQSSTQPKGNNTYLYPSVSAGFVFTDAFNIDSDIFSYGKIRGNVAQVGRDADPYVLESYYVSGGQGNNVANVTFPFNGVVGFRPSPTIGGGQNLKPEFTKSAEVGLNLGFFNNRLTLDATYFKTVSSNQILPVTLAGSTGYTSFYTNAGQLDNKGLEVLATLSPVRSASGFSWDISANYTRLRNVVTAIYPGVTSSSILGSSFIGSVPSYVVGQPYGVILGQKKATAPDGQYLINPRTGLWATELSAQVTANPNVDWQGGITNTLAYKGLTFSFLVDATVGGDILSFTQAAYKSAGMLQETGVGRDQPRVIPGVIAVANPDGTTSYNQNNIQVDAQSYWSNQGLQSDLNIFDGTHFTMREVSLGYSLPKDLLARTPFGSASLSISGRNLFYYAPNTNFFPEVNTQGAGNIRGLDLQGAPNVRSYGAYLRFSF
ncbi:SusC/RagA family TonB-linked outer membrane protein [Hymenobacter sp. H14-R3]|uniref:SusC/RagA family TonB-linked outer membrane protein n=1 Tax=Hymenobacter sp. H14-R3 TaxID=3046308 RepID=UPI0024BAE8ED|nr:SusC/RagA family TonB-linked outer membrane protein [Hymenobacter sp. H14-R3]MDJ0363967.1 SusC/RagA family TonB-linked outer membrane protein [Hymenobacter sp. H14-R3]